MTDPWNGARSEPTLARRVRLALVLILALALPGAIIGLGSHKPVDAIEVSAISSSAASIVGTVSISIQATQAPETTEDPSLSFLRTINLDLHPDTIVAVTSTAPRAVSAAPTTTTTSKPKATSATQPVVAQAAVTSPPTTRIPEPPTTVAPVVNAAPPSVGGADLAFLACIRKRESGGNYAVVSANGLYYGAYQFLQSTWNGAAGIAGRPDLVGRRPNTVAPSDQDAVALAYYHAVGPGPWGGYCH